MYDFYANPPKNKKDLREWLTSWLEKPKSDPHILDYKGEQFIFESGFRRAFSHHSVYRNLSTNEYVWWVVSDDDSENYMDTFPNVRYPDFETMLENVIHDYYVAWKLSD